MNNSNGLKKAISTACVSVRNRLEEAIKNANEAKEKAKAKQVYLEKQKAQALLNSELAERDKWIKEFLPVLIRTCEEIYNLNNFSRNLSTASITSVSSTSSNNSSACSHHAYNVPTLSSYQKVKDLSLLLNNCRQQALIVLNGEAALNQRELQNLQKEYNNTQLKISRLSPTEPADCAAFALYQSILREIEFDMQKIQEKITQIAKCWNYGSHTTIISTKHFPHCEYIEVRFVR